MTSTPTSFTSGGDLGEAAAASAPDHVTGSHSARSARPDSPRQRRSFAYDICAERAAPCGPVEAEPRTDGAGAPLPASPMATDGK